MSAHEHDAHHHEHTDSVWVRTEANVFGPGYMVVVEHDQDHAVTYDQQRAYRYAAAVLAAAAYAEYDAAVARQMYGICVAAFEEDGDTATAEKDAQIQAVATVNQLRKTRTPLDEAATRPLALVPGVAAGWKPFLRLDIEGKTVGQWDPDSARTHALTVIEALAVAELDAAYLDHLTRVVGMPEHTARGVIAMLADDPERT